MHFPPPLLLTAAVCGLLLTAAPVEAGLADHTLDIYWNDVEGGGATLIVTPAGESVLIDSGNPGGRDSARIFKTAAEVAGLKKIDFYLQTHFHIDHIGGVGELAALIPIGQVYERTIPDHDPDGNGASGDAFWTQISGSYRTFKSDRRNHLEAGTVIPLKAAPGTGALGFTLRCIAADQKFIEAPANGAKNPLTAQLVDHDKSVLAPTDNDNSAAFVLDFGPFRFWDGGDLTWNMEGKVVTPVNRVGQVDVYQVDHHGLSFSNNPILIHSLAPTVAVMNNGSNKGTEKAPVEALKSSPGISDIYQVHKDLRAANLANNAPDEFCANLVSTARPATAPGNIIKLSVAPDGKNYTITIPATGHTKTYQTRLDKEGPGGQK